MMSKPQETKPGDILIALAFAAVLLPIVCWFSLHDTHATAVVAGAIMGSCILVVAAALPVCSLLLFLRGRRELAFWKKLSERHQPLSAVVSDWQQDVVIRDPNNDENSLAIKLASSADGIVLSPEIPVPRWDRSKLLDGDPISDVLMYLLALPLILPCLYYKAVMRPIQIRWAEVKALQWQENRLLVELEQAPGATLNLTVPEPAFSQLKQDIPQSLLARPD